MLSGAVCTPSATRKARTSRSSSAIPTGEAIVPRSSPKNFVRLGVDVIVAHYALAVSAAMAATRTIPIVMAPHGAPLQLGVIDSLARPGGNVTGLSGMDAEIGGKRVQLLRELIPNLGSHRSSRHDRDHNPV